MEAERRTFLETITQNQPLETSLRRLVHILENQLPGALCSIMLLKPDKSCHVAASSFSKEVLMGLEGFKLEEIGRAFGMGAECSEMAFVEDSSVGALIKIAGMDDSSQPPVLLGPLPRWTRRPGGRLDAGVFS